MWYGQLADAPWLLPGHPPTHLPSSLLSGPPCADLNFLYIATRFLEFINPQLTRASLSAIVGDIRASMLEEVDFRKEAEHIQVRARGCVCGGGDTLGCFSPAKPCFHEEGVFTRGIESCIWWVADGAAC